MRISFITGLMLVALAARADTSPSPAPFVAEETPVKVRLLQPLKSNHERSGDRIRFETVEDVVAPDRSLLIPKGTPVGGTVTHASHRGMLGKPGRLEFSIDFIQASADVRVPLRRALTAVRGRDNSGGTIAAGVILMPLCLLISGRDITISEGREFTVFVDQKTALLPTAATIAAIPPAPASPSPVALLAAARPDLAHLQDFHLKSGGVITGSVRTEKDGMYFVLTETGEVIIDREMLAFIEPKKR